MLIIALGALAVMFCAAALWSRMSDDADGAFVSGMYWVAGVTLGLVAALLVITDAWPISAAFTMAFGAPG